MNPKPLQQVEILLVEDNPADVLMTRSAFEDFKLTNTLHVVEDGVEALEYLHGEGKFAGSPHPDLIMLDLNLPRKNGREVLAEIKTDPALLNIPVIVLTTSRSEQDVLEAYGLHANCYIVKPVGFPNFVEAIKSIEHFWFSLVTLPSEVENGKK
ncbi:MAG TPA: response regulator [Anaerolineales bacterium]|nr:response regulator [Anaerolineales bacterium]HNA88097.1 response regulator [Anaerolineales bacterium]HNC08226.1 response regulator [Anaerolineales bacterium]